MNSKIKNVTVVLFGFLLILGVGLKKTINFSDYYPTVIVDSFKFDSKENKELLKNEKIVEEFTSNYNNLGIISVKFNTHSKINNDKLQFRIKESKTNEWYYTNEYKVDEFQNNEYYAFGFPEIKDSKGKKYQFEISSLDGSGNNSIQVISKNSVFLSKYSFSKTYLLQNKDKIPRFLFDKTKSFFKNIGLKSYIYILVLLIIIWLVLTKKNIKRLSKYVGSDKCKLHSSAFCLLIIYNILTLTFAKQMLFCDEADNLLGGKIVSSGFLIYKDFYSQHTPLMYYICAFINWLGVNSVVMYRIYFFFILSLIWIFMYIRYSKYFGKLTMALYPLFYIFMLGYIPLGNTILSEQIQSTALVILLLEFLLYEKNKFFKYDNYIVIALSIFFSIGTAMVSVFPVFVFFIGVFVLQIYWMLKDKIGLTIFFKKFVKKFLVLILVTLIPFLIIILMYFKQGVLSNAYYQIFTFNTQVYSKYNGYGSNLLSTFEAPIHLYPSFIAKVMNNLFVTDFITNAQFLIGIVSVFVFIWILFRENKKILSVFCFLFVLMCGTRTYEGFHAIPYYAVTAIIFSILVYKFLYLPYKNLGVYKNVPIILIISSIIILSTSFFINYRVFEVKDFFKDSPLSPIQLDIVKITDENDRIFVNNLDGYTYLAVNRLPTTKIWTLVPWFADVYENEVIDDLKADNTKIVIYTQELDIWGYKAKDFAPELKKYIENNYTKLNKNDPNCIEWIRNDYLNEAREKIEL